MKPYIINIFKDLDSGTWSIRVLSRNGTIDTYDGFTDSKSARLCVNQWLSFESKV